MTEPVTLAAPAPQAVTTTKQKYLKVPYGCTVHGEAEIAAVVKVLQTSTQMGDNVRAMERRVATLCAKQHGVMLNSGSSANYLAIEIANLPAGSEVITPALTFSTTVAPLIKNNLVPAFVDVELDTFNINTNLIEAMITPQTRAMMVPNLLGNLPNWQALRELADHYQLMLIEDSADTLGAHFNGDLAGRYSDITTTSFYGSHVINCAGNGGMLCVNESEFAERAKLLRSWGRSSSLFVESEAIENRFNTTIDNIPYDAKFVFEAVGYNFEPSEMGAAFGLVQLDKLANNINCRQDYFQQQLNFFNQFSDWFVLPRQQPNSVSGWLAYPMIVRDAAPFNRRELQIYLEKCGIQTRTVLTGNILRQPGFANISHKATAAGYACADYVTRGGILLGCHHGMTADMLAHIHESFANFIEKFK
jgi:CDP-4-dehydro-6-deoxyglucose reductase, E1